MSFKTIRFLKNDWLKNVTESGGAQNSVIENKSKTDLVIHSHTQKHGRLWCSMNPEQVLQNIKNNNGLYEVITSFPYKVYFDIDKDE
jgi:hypothetical protein